MTVTTGHNSIATYQQQMQPVAVVGRQDHKSRKMQGAQVGHLVKLSIMHILYMQGYVYYSKPVYIICMTYSRSALSLSSLEVVLSSPVVSVKLPDFQQWYWRCL